MLEWWIWGEWFPIPYQGKIRPNLAGFSEQCRPVDCMDPTRMIPPLYLGAHPEMLELTKLTDQPPLAGHPQVPDPRRHPQPAHQLVGPARLPWSRQRSSSRSTPIRPRGCSEIHMIWTDSPCWITCWNDSNTYIQALQSPSIECIVAQHPWLENDCLMADIILPVSTRFEMLDIGNDLGSGVLHLRLPGGATASTPWASRSATSTSWPRSPRSWGCGRSILSGKTMEEKQKLAFDASGMDELVILGGAARRSSTSSCPAATRSRTSRPASARSRNDPKNNPLTTPTGLLEYSSSALEKHFPDDPERPPVAHWIEKSESHDERLSSERTEQYPLLCMSNHPRWRMHAQGDDITWTQRGSRP